MSRDYEEIEAHNQILEAENQRLRDIVKIAYAYANEMHEEGFHDNTTLDLIELGRKALQTESEGEE